VYFGELRDGEVRRIAIPRTRVNKGKEKGRGCLDPLAPMPTTRTSTENKRPDDQGRRRVGARLSPPYHPFAALYLV
jgi:hypothetical protein